MQALNRTRETFYTGKIAPRRKRNVCSPGCHTGPIRPVNVSDFLTKAPVNAGECLGCGFLVVDTPAQRVA